MDRTVRLHPLHEENKSMTFPSEEPVMSVTVSSDGGLVAAGCADGGFCIWNLKKGVATRHAKHGVPGLVNSIILDVHGTTFFSSDTDGSIKSWHWDDIDDLPPTQTRHLGGHKVRLKLSRIQTGYVNVAYTLFRDLWLVSCRLLLLPFSPHRLTMEFACGTGWREAVCCFCAFVEGLVRKGSQFLHIWFSTAIYKRTFPPLFVF